MRKYVGYRAATKRRIGEGEQSADFLERDRRQAFALDLGNPFLRHRLKCVRSGDAGSDLVQLALLRWINAFGEQSPRLVSLGSCAGPLDFGPHLEGQRLVIW